MPTYTIAGKKVTSPEPLTPEELDALYDQIAGEAPKVEPLPRGPTTRGGKRTPGVPLRQRPFVERRVPMRPDEYGERFGAEPEMGPSLKEVGKAAVGTALGVPGGVVDIARGVTELGGESETSRMLKDLEARIARGASIYGDKRGYEAGKLIPEIAPYAATASLVSKLPIASRAGMAGAQILGQAGTAYGVTPEEEGKGEAALIAGGLGAAGEAAPYLISGGRRAYAAGKRLLQNVGPAGATPEELAALRITQGKDVGREAAERELTAAREAERVKQEQAQALKQKYLEEKALRDKQKADLQTQKAAAQEEKFNIKSESDKAVADAKAKQESMQVQLQDKARELRDEAKGTDKVLEETNIREAGAEAAGTLEDKAKSFRELSEKLAKEADDAAQVKVEMPDVRPKKERATSFRDMILGRLERLKAAREEAIGRTVDPITGAADPLPFLKNALDKEDAGQTVSEAAGFKNLVSFAANKAEDVTRYGDKVRRAHQRLLDEIQPIKETVDENGQVVKEVLPIRYEKLLEERRLIAEARKGEEETGYAAITGKAREDLLKKIDDVLDEFGTGYKNFNEQYTRASKPIDEFEFGVGEKASETRKFSRANFVNDPETVLDAALSKPSKSSAERLKASYFDEADYGELESIVKESLTEKAGGSAKGYEKVLKDYGEFLEEFPAARDALRADADRFVLASDEAAKTAAFKKRWAEKMEERAKRAEKAVSSISGLQAKVKTSLSSPLKEGALDEIAAFTRANPNMRPKIGAALQDVLKSVDDKTIVRALEVPERQAAFMRAGMEREQIADVLDTARRNIADRAAKVDEVRQMGLAVREAKKATKETAQASKEAQEAVAQKVRETGREIGRLDEAGKAEGLAVDQATAEFQAARNLRVTARDKRKALSDLTLDMRDAINLAAEQIPLNTTEGLAKATSLATIVSGVGTVVSGSPLAGALTALGALAATKGRQFIMKRQQVEIANRIESIVNKIMQDETGSVAGAIGRKIDRAEQVAQAQRIANKALAQLGFKPGTGAVTSNMIYTAYAKEPEEETVEEPVEKARGGVAYTPAEEMLLKRYSTGGPASRPTLPADRAAGYKQEGDEENRLKRFLEAAATELPPAIKQSVTSNADLAAKYLKFKFGMMSPDEMMSVARALPESLKGAAVAAMQTVKEAPRAVAEATPESAGKFTAQMVASELTDPTKLGKAVAKPIMQAAGPYKPKPSPKLEVDNPGGSWLQENREYSESKGYLPSGAPRSFGKVTAVWRDPNNNEVGTVYLPVSMLKQFRGVMDEQNNVRQKDLDWLTENMGKTKSLPKTSRGTDYMPFVTVDQRGIPFISEGNHRIMAAEKLGWEWLPVEVRYFNGSEQVDGPLNPKKIEELLNEYASR